MLLFCDLNVWLHSVILRVMVWKLKAFVKNVVTHTWMNSFLFRKVTPVTKFNFLAFCSIVYSNSHKAYKLGFAFVNRLLLPLYFHQKHIIYFLFYHFKSGKLERLAVVFNYPLTEKPTVIWSFYLWTCGPHWQILETKISTQMSDTCK